MATGTGLSAAIVGTRGHLVKDEADFTEGLPAFSLVGLPDAWVSELRDLVRQVVAPACAGCRGQLLTYSAAVRQRSSPPQPGSKSPQQSPSSSRSNNFQEHHLRPRHLPSDQSH